jgi:eukaryotic-like serine/threonine-protein kinase
MAVTTVLPPRYRDPGRIARGGMGEIYRATDDVLGRVVAIKLLAERYSVDDEVGKRFMREALAAARLSGQPNTVMIFDVGEWNDRPFIVMEHLAGGSLGDLLAAEGPQPAERVIPWLAQAAAALDSAHANGIVHRDVKPANLLLDSDGVVHVADFGIASAAGLDALTSTGVVLGTAGYLSPEQAQGAGTTPASDRYALGVTAFELLTGERPFQSEAATGEAAAHVHAAVPSIYKRRPELDLPSELDPVFERGLAKAPLSRYASCGEFVAELSGALDRAAGQTVVLPSTTLSRAVPSAMPARRRYRLPLALGLVATAGAGIALATLPGGGDPTVVKKATLSATTIRATVTERTTVEQTVTTMPPTAAPPYSGADGHALNEQGYAKVQAGDFAGALPALQQAVEKLRGHGPADPTEAYANYNLGYALLQLGRCDEALISLRTADELEDHRDVRKAIKSAEKCLRKEGEVRD